jgi:hypothetical protein
MSSFRLIIPSVIILIIIFILSGCSSKESTKQKRLLKDTIIWQFPMNNDSIGIFSNPVDAPTRILLHGNIIYFNDPTFCRLNALNTSTGSVKWGIKKSIPDDVEHLAYFSNHIFITSQRSNVFVFDSNLCLVDSKRIGDSVSVPTIDSMTEDSLTIITTYDLFNDTGTGQSSYLEILMYDKSLHSSLTRSFLGRTSHLDERYSKEVQEAINRVYNTNYKVAGKKFTIDTVEDNLWLNYKRYSFQLPKHLLLFINPLSIDFDDNHVVAWVFDEAKNVFSITLFIYT